MSTHTFTAAWRNAGKWYYYQVLAEWAGIEIGDEDVNPQFIREDPQWQQLYQQIHDAEAAGENALVDRLMAEITDRAREVLAAAKGVVV